MSSAPHLAVGLHPASATWPGCSPVTGLTPVCGVAIAARDMIDSAQTVPIKLIILKEVKCFFNT